MTRTGLPNESCRIPVDPAFAEMFRILHDFAVAHDGRESDRNRVVAPAFHRLFDRLDHLLRRELRAGIEISAFPRGEIISFTFVPPMSMTRTFFMPIRRAWL